MLIPKYYEMHKPFLELIHDGQLHSLKDLKVKMATYFNLDELSLAELLPSGRQTIFVNRIGWARTYLKKAGLIDSPSRAMFVITQLGLDTLKDNPSVIDNEYLLKFDSFREFQKANSQDVSISTTLVSDNDTPDDTFEDSFTYFF